jgi:hypothetical protein
MLQAKWSIQDCKFHSDLKVLDLQNCDMVIGIEWLERFSPMKVHWAQKWLTIPYHKSQVTLQGILPGVIVYNMVELLHLATESQPEESDHIPDVIQDILISYQGVFEDPAKLPPKRQCDHKIPLIQGASPVQARLYHYAPALKDEIEKQVKEMLQADIIQHNTSAFSSPILLVKKKDNT